jgi:uncharacterized membrane protein
MCACDSTIPGRTASGSGEARGTWLDSHFRWQIRTFWYGLLWVALCAVLVVLTLGLGLIVV